jgi:hypothetical protein
VAYQLIYQTDALEFKYLILSPTFVCLFVSMGVRGKPRMYCSLLAYCTARFGRSKFGHQMPRAYRRVPHSSG